VYPRAHITAAAVINVHRRETQTQSDLNYNYRPL